MAKKGKGNHREPSSRRPQTGRVTVEEGDYNSDMDDEVDAFIASRNKVDLESEESGADSDGSIEDEEAVMDLEGEDSDDDEDDDDDANDGDMFRGHAPIKLRGKLEDEEGSDYEAEMSKVEKMSSKWGKKKRMYYDADTADADLDEDVAADEEEEAKRLQKQQLEEMDDNDFFDDAEGDEEEPEDDTTEISAAKKKGKKSNAAKEEPAMSALSLAAALDLNDIDLGDGEEEPVEIEKVQKDFSKLTKKQRLEILHKESPELMGLLEELNKNWERATRLDDILRRTSSLPANDKPSSKAGINVLRLQQQLSISYCSNILFRLLMQAEGVKARDHPVFERLLQIREHLDHFEKDGNRLVKEVKELQQKQVKEPKGESTDKIEHVRANRNKRRSKESKSKPTSELHFRTVDDEELLRNEEDDAKFLSLPEAQPQRSLGMSEATEFVELSKKQLQGEKKKQKEEKEQKLKRRQPEMDPSFSDSFDEEREAFEEGLDDFFSGSAGQKKKRGRPEESFTDDEQDAEDMMAPRSSQSGGKKRKQATSSAVLKGVSKEELADAEQFMRDATKSKKKLKELRNEQYSFPEQRAFVSDNEDGDSEDERKRGINYQIMKNKGLTAHKNKLNRNPRVKKRMQYGKAVIRRKGQVQDMRVGEASRYGGETTGIRSKITKSRKFK